MGRSTYLAANSFGVRLNLDREAVDGVCAELARLGLLSEEREP